jgi:two-component sensor histidine kinase
VGVAQPDQRPRPGRRHLEAAWPDIAAERLDIARLLASELVSNAVRHGAGPVVLILAQAGNELRVGVEDDSPTLPVLTATPVLAGGGQGLQLVAALASRWGVAARDGGRPGKQVWFELT